jgi:arylsulfatase A-like enzyme
MKNICFSVIAGICILTGCTKEPDRPNIVLIMGDDIGFSDIGCYGGEISTPTLDSLAYAGYRFSTFYNMAKCNPSRSTLLTGLYGGGNGAVPLGGLLKEHGYTTLLSGKEHFDDWVPDYCRAENNFDNRFYFWATTEYFIPPGGEFENPFFLNGQEQPAGKIYHERAPFYKTDVFVDHALKWLDEAETKEDERPFFLYLPFHAAHYPLQAPAEDIAKYQGTYLTGWDHLRRQRFNRMKQMGIIPGSAELSIPEGNIHKYRKGLQAGTPEGDLIPLYRPWDSLDMEEKVKLDLEMAVYAAMIDRLDQNLARVVRWLKTHGEYENTIIIYTTDNGACPFDSNRDLSIPPGPAESYRTLGAAWANMCNTPFRYFKQFGHEGGCHSQCIVKWPGQVRGKSVIIDQPGHIVDIFPTLLELLDIPYPEEYAGFRTIPLHGKSLIPLLNGNRRDSCDYFISGNGEQFRMFRRGDWKIVRANHEEWELYDMDEDPTETDNMADRLPGKLNEMRHLYDSVRQDLSLQERIMKE